MYSKYRLQNYKWTFSIGELPEDLKKKLSYPRLHYCNIGEFMESKILHACAGEGFRLFESVCRLKLKRAFGGGAVLVSGLVKA